MVDDKSIKWPQYMAALSATGGALAAGTMLGWTAPAEPLLIDESEYGFPISKEQFSWIGAAVNLGAATVCIPIGILIKLLGRKLTMLLLVLPFTLGWLLISFSQNVAMMIAGRYIIGIAGGAFCITAPLYTAEIAQKEIRGSLGVYFQLMVCAGILFIYAIGAGLSVFVMSLICTAIPVIFGAIFIFMPETPLYLVYKGKTEQAISSLEFLRGKAYDSGPELKELEEENATINEKKVSIKDAFARKSTQRSLIIVLGLMFFQQACGINAVIFYASTIFRASGSSMTDSVSTIIIGVVQLVACFGSTLIVDRLGRRLLLLLSAGIMAICTILLGIYFFLKDRDEDSVESISWLPILALCVFVTMFSIGYGPVPWLMLGELFATDIKGVASSLGGTFNWLLAFVVTKTFTNLVSSLGLGETFWLFSALSIVGTVFTYFVVPETKGKSLREIQIMLGAK